MKSEKREETRGIGNFLEILFLTVDMLDETKCVLTLFLYKINQRQIIYKLIISLKPLGCSFPDAHDGPTYAQFWVSFSI